MKLAMPFVWSGKTCVEVELGRITAEGAADARATAETGDYFATLLQYLASVVRSVTFEDGKTEVDRGQVRNILRDMPASIADHVSLVSLARDGAEWIEGYYECPRCGTAKICEGDTADKLSDLAVVHAAVGATIEVTLRSPVTVTNKETGDPLMTIDTLKLRHPTLRDYIAAFARAGADQVRHQLAAYGSAVLEVNGRPVDDQWRAQWGSWVLGKMDVADANEISRQVREVGLQRWIEKTCNKCKRVWKAEVSTSGFFASALGGR